MNRLNGKVIIVTGGNGLIGKSLIDKLKLELKRLNAIGGAKRIVPIEGIVFVYNGQTFKLTGAFASLNQLLGIFYA